MKKGHVNKIFVFLVFVIVASVVVKDVSLSGNAVAQAPVLEKVGKFDSKNFYFDIAQGFNYEVSNAKAGNVFYAVKGENKYAMLVLRVYENYELSDQHVTLLVSPGSKRLSLGQGESALIDFDNNQRSDTKVTLVSVAGSSAKLIFSTP